MVSGGDTYGMKKVRFRIEHTWRQEFGLVQSSLKLHINLAGGFMR